MNISLWTKSKINNELFIYEDWAKNVNKDIKDYFEHELILKKDQKIKIWTYSIVKWKNISSYIIVKVKKLKEIKDLIEDLISGVWAEIKKLDKKVFLDFDNIKIDQAEKQLIVEFLAINLYTFNKYKSDSKVWYELIISDKSINKKQFESFVNNLALVRNLVNEPANVLNPETFENIAKDLLKSNKKVTLEVLKWDKLKKLWMNGIYDVGRGSEYEPRLLILNYKWNSSKKIDFALVGKWVCFDSWGYNMKPTGYIEDMKDDMAGAATVLWVLNHLATVWTKKNIVVAMPIVENLVSWNAYKPWDVLKMYNGKTVEIKNTDAEWRLILADSLTYVDKKFKPSYIFDVATLTWAQIIALGNKVAAIIWNNDKLNKKVQEISWDIKERVWELPNYAPYFKWYKSNIADMVNSGAWRYWPWTIQAWLFLSKFVENKNWIHFDIAWPATSFTWPDDVWWTWASWFGYRLFIKLIEELK